MITVHLLFILLCNLSVAITVCGHLHMQGQTQSQSQTRLSSLTRRRLLHELEDIAAARMTLKHPLNLTDRHESGVRLSPLKGNLLEWHFSFTGMDGTAYDGGLYHGLILLDPLYPSKPPSIALITPTGRWDVLKSICLSASAHHQETWDSNWTLRTLVMSLRNFMTTQPKEIGAISTTPEERQHLAGKSRDFYCPKCGTSHPVLLGHQSISSQLPNIVAEPKDFSRSNKKLNSKKKIAKKPGKPSSSKRQIETSRESRLIRLKSFSMSAIFAVITTVLIAAAIGTMFPDGSVFFAVLI